MGRLDDAKLSDLMRAGLAGDSDAYRSVFHNIVPVLINMIARMAPALPQISVRILFKISLHRCIQKVIHGSKQDLSCHVYMRLQDTD